MAQVVPKKPIRSQPPMKLPYMADVSERLRIQSHTRDKNPFLVACKTYIKPSTFVKYVIKLVGATNPIANSKFVEQYVMNNKANQIF
jgi:hypothetical protein